MVQREYILRPSASSKTVPTRHRNIKPNSITVVNIMVLREIRSLPHICENQGWIDKGCESNLHKYESLLKKVE